LGGGVWGVTPAWIGGSGRPYVAETFNIVPAVAPAAARGGLAICRGCRPEIRGGVAEGIEEEDDWGRVGDTLLAEVGGFRALRFESSADFSFEELLSLASADATPPKEAVVSAASFSALLGLCFGDNWFLSSSSSLATSIFTSFSSLSLQ
jgi:hypothetical protein